MLAAGDRALHSLSSASLTVASPTRQAGDVAFLLNIIARPSSHKINCLYCKCTIPPCIVSCYESGKKMLEKKSEAPPAEESDLDM